MTICMVRRAVLIIFFISTVVVGGIWSSEKKSWNEDNYEGWVWRKSLNFKLPNNGSHFVDADAIHQELSNRTHRLVENLREKSRNVVLLRLGLVLEDKDGNQGYALLPCFDDYIFSSGMDKDKGKDTFISESNLTQGLVMTNESKTPFILHSYITDEPRNYSFSLENRLRIFKSRFETRSEASSLKLEKYKNQNSEVKECLIPPKGDIIIKEENLLKTIRRELKDRDRYANDQQRLLSIIEEGLLEEDILSVAENALNTIKRGYEDRIERYTDSEQKFLFFMEESLSPIPFFWDLCLPPLIGQLINDVEDYYAFLQYESSPEYLGYQENVLRNQILEKLTQLGQEINDQNQNDLKRLCNELKEVRKQRELSPEELEKAQREIENQRFEEIKKELVRGSKCYDTSHNQYSSSISEANYNFLIKIGEFKNTLNKPQISDKEKAIKTTRKGDIEAFFSALKGYEPSDLIPLKLLENLKEMKKNFDEIMDRIAKEIMEKELLEKSKQKERLEQDIKIIKEKIDQRILKITQHEMSPDIEVMLDFSKTLDSLLRKISPKKYSKLKYFQKTIEERIMVKKELTYKKWMNILFSYLEKTDKKVLGIVLHLHSRNDVCHFCGPSITRECERTDGFVAKLTNICDILNKNRYEDTISPFFRILFSCNEIRNKNTNTDRSLYTDNSFNNLIHIDPRSTRYDNLILLDSISAHQDKMHEVYPLKPIVFFQCHVPHTGF